MSTGTRKKEAEGMAKHGDRCVTAVAPILIRRYTAILLALIFLTLIREISALPEGERSPSAGLPNNGSPGTPASRIDIHLFGGDLGPGAPLAAWYRSVGITDVWLYFVKGVFPQDQPPESQLDLASLEDTGVLAGYRREGIRFWWFERPVPDYLYYLNMGLAELESDGIWGRSPSVDRIWESIGISIANTYGRVRNAGFSGLVFDNEAYYSYKGSGTPWLWEGHSRELGLNGNYYRRGLQVGQYIQAAWSGAHIIMVYGIGYPGEYWWYRGFHDSGVDLFLAVEHTYGAGPWKPGDQWYQHWWSPLQLKGVIASKREVFDFIEDDRHILAGLFPIDFTLKSQNYAFRYFAQQLGQAAQLSGNVPFGVWIWPQGPFTPDSWQTINYTDKSSFADYWEIMKSYSTNR
jgi:hypothetical protein